jgi:hypothetical protein
MGRLFQSDAELGYAHIPGSRGFMMFPLGPELPVRNDSRGFRIPVWQDSDALSRPLVLGLGCSVTYGDACLAEDTYTYLTGKALGGSSINAGACGYGLEQMLLLARKLIPQYKPDYVLVQFSGWLVARAMTGFAPVYWGKAPVPFYTRDDAGKLYLHPRLFDQKVFDLPISDYKGGSWGAFDLLSFFFRVGAPLFIHDDLNVLWVYAQDYCSRIFDGHSLFADARLTREVIDHTYREIEKVCRENGSHMIIVRLGIDVNDRKAFEPPNIPGAVYVDAESELQGRLPNLKPDTYNRAYAHWRGDPPVMVDGHPNPEAHRIIAEEIVKAINGLQESLVETDIPLVQRASDSP